MKTVSFEKLRKQLLRSTKEERKRNLKPIRFRGFDWCEIAKIYDLEVKGDETIWARIVRDRLWESVMVADGHRRGGIDGRPDYVLAKWQLRQARRYVMALSESEHHYDSHVWESIALIKDDSTFVNWITTFLEAAWS